MENYNSYIGRLDYSKFIQFAKDKGKVHIYHKNDFLLSKTKCLTKLDGLKPEHFVIYILIKTEKSMLWNIHLPKSLSAITLLLYIKVLHW